VPLDAARSDRVHSRAASASATVGKPEREIISVSMCRQYSDEAVSLNKTCRIVGPPPVPLREDVATLSTTALVRRARFQCAAASPRSASRIASKRIGENREGAKKSRSAVGFGCSARLFAKLSVWKTK
jgi:hypothetical protein